MSIAFAYNISVVKRFDNFNNNLYQIICTHRSSNNRRCRRISPAATYKSKAYEYNIILLYTYYTKRLQAHRQDYDDRIIIHTDRACIIIYYIIPTYLIAGVVYTCTCIIYIPIRYLVPDDRENTICHG